MIAWDIAKVVEAFELIASANGLPRENVRRELPPGDYCGGQVFLDTGELIAWVSATPFRTDGVSICEQGVPDVEFVEVVESSADCRGGLQSRDPEVRRLFHAVEDALTEMGFSVVPSMSDYF